MKWIAEKFIREFSTQHGERKVPIALTDATRKACLARRASTPPSTLVPSAESSRILQVPPLAEVPLFGPAVDVEDGRLMQYEEKHPRAPAGATHL